MSKRERQDEEEEEEEEEEADEPDDAASPSDTGVAAASASVPDEAPVRRACSTCETSNEPDAAFCKKCGTSLHVTEAKTDAS